MKKLFLLSFFLILFSPTLSFGALLTDAECAAQNPGGFCSAEGKVCSYTQEGSTSVGSCTDGTSGTLFLRKDRQCCKPKEVTPTPTETPTATFNYTPLEDIPGQGKPADFPAYVRALYAFTLATVGIAALLMVIVGGFLYVTSAGNTSRVEKGKEFIRDALLGILVAFLSWLVLYVINPDLVDINLESLQKLTVSEAENEPSGEPWNGTPTDGGGVVEGIGDCSGFNLSGLKCALISQALQNFLTCLKTNAPVPMTITSITSRRVDGDLEKSKACCQAGKKATAMCPHTGLSWHHGCKTSNPGYSYAIDLGMTNNNPNYCTIANAAVRCGAVEKLGPRTDCGIKGAKGHDTHFHFSVGG